MSLEKSAFEFVAALEGTETLSELETTLGKYLAPLGVDFFMAGQLVFPKGVVKPMRLFGAFDFDWFRFYDSYHLILEDPAARHVKRASQPFTWSWIADTFDLTAGEKFVMNEPRNFGLSDGLAVPVYGPGGALAVVSVAGKHFKPDFRETTAIQMMVTQAYNKAVKISGLFESQAGARLTRRQRECLNWLQHGKSYRDIAAILEISPDTVKEHIEGAKKAFGVSTRIEAVVQARRENLIGL